MSLVDELFASLWYEWYLTIVSGSDWVVSADSSKGCWPPKFALDCESLSESFVAGRPWNAC